MRKFTNVQMCGFFEAVSKKNSHICTLVNLHINHRNLATPVSLQNPFHLLHIRDIAFHY
jgi:hypothetical protein